MIGVKVTTTGGEIFNDIRKQLADTVTRFPRKVAREVVPVVERYGDRLVKDRLGVYPPPRNRATKFLWSRNRAANNRARRWFFANYPNGYTRTGELGRNWRTLIIADKQGGAVIGVENDARGASYVYGAPEFNYQQVPGHVSTGWINTEDEAPQVLNLITDRYEQELQALLFREIDKL